MSIGPSDLTAADLDRLRAAGIDEAEARRQLELLRRPPAPIRLARPCSVGDGIRVLGDREGARLEESFERALEARRLVRFVPASGAASRMFQALLEPGESGAEARRRLVAELSRLPFATDLKTTGPDCETSAGGEDPERLVRWLLELPGLGFRHLPKGLIPFHRTAGGGARTPVEEHLRQSIAVTGGRPAGVHFTVSPEHRPHFESMLAELLPHLERELGTELEVTLSEQAPSTRTLAVDAEGRPFRAADSRLLLRPGGHGSLIENLGRLEADLALLKNVDNVLPDERQAEAVRTERRLGGLLVELAEHQQTLVRQLREGGDPTPELHAAAAAFLEHELGLAAPPLSIGVEACRRRLLDRLERPLRVCGVVPNTGEPGGGPFWVIGADGELSLQIVETSQIDRENRVQSAILERSTHFNPVLLLCTLCDGDGHRYPLERYIDPQTAFVASKTEAGQALRALEHPGLWNGAMAGWNTVFVEIPGATFAPVKTLFDLLRPEHQPDSDAASPTTADKAKDRASAQRGDGAAKPPTRSGP